VPDVDELRQRLIYSWLSIRQTYLLDEAVDQWRVRLRAVLGPKADTLNICFNVLLLHCWFIACILALYDVSLKMFDVIMKTLKSSITLVVYNASLCMLLPHA